MDLELGGKVVVVTGAASGIGEAIVEYFHLEGARLVLVDLQEEQLGLLAAKLERQGAEAVAVKADVRSHDECEAAIDAALGQFGRVDVLVNSAGIAGPMALFLETEPSAWDDLIEVNLRGVMNCCRAAARPMIMQRAGRIINIASEAGKGNERRMVVYGATKGGVISLSRGLAVELGRYGITVNAVCPGVVRTPMTAFLTDDMERAWARFYPLGRLGRPEDVAPLVVFLASKEASWITGQAISVNGGFGRS